MHAARTPLLTSLVLPAYNPGPILTASLDRLDSLLSTSTEAWEILFVCDGCSDNTADRLEAWAQQRGPRARVLSYPTNQGKGNAVRLGLLEARGTFRLFTDIDLAYDLPEIRRVASVLWAGHPVAYADRSLADSRVLLPAHLLRYAQWRQLQSWVFNQLVRRLLPIQAGDTQAGLKGLRVDVVADVVPQLTCTGFAFDCELLTACHRRGWPTLAVPVTVRLDDRSSTTTALSTWQMVRALFAVRRQWCGSGVTAASALPPVDVSVSHAVVPMPQPLPADGNGLLVPRLEARMASAPAMTRLAG
ncbi:MAG TPA: glycosyltransferase [Gemmatales bacterium]|nr:glycosyltransferase [Gemmatales bacterium]